MLILLRVIHSVLAVIIAWILIKAGLRYLMGEEANELIAFMALLITFQTFDKLIVRYKKEND